MEEYFLKNLCDNIGQTVTIFTTSGGDSGAGFTGVLTTVNSSFVRLVNQLGPAPGCALGNCCDNNFPRGTNENGQVNGINCRGNGLGSITDIPVCKIAAFVHNSIGN